MNSKLSNTIVNFRINAMYTYKKIHNFNLSLVTLYKTIKTLSKTSLTEFTTTLGYSFSFTTNDEKKKSKTNVEDSKE
jgi:hypothetical protein